MRKLKIKANVLRLTEEINALDYLEQAYYYICQTEINIKAWKWVILSLHGALYGYAICALKGPNLNNVTTKGKMWLIRFDEALKRCQDPNWMQLTVFSKHLQLTDRQKESIRQLKDDYRNFFEHYVPMIWRIEIHGLPQMAIDVLEVIRFLAVECGNYNCLMLSWSQKKKIKTLVSKSIRFLKESQLYKEFCLAKRMSEDRKPTKQESS